MAEEKIGKIEALQEHSSMEDSLDVINITMEKFLESASVEAVYGKPIKNGDTVIIPTAEILSGMGFGVGSGSGAEGTGDMGTGSGGGGGGRVLSRPVSVIISGPDGVRVEPIVDVTKIALAALTASGFMLGMLLKMARGSQD